MNLFFPSCFKVCVTFLKRFFDHKSIVVVSVCFVLLLCLWCLSPNCYVHPFCLSVGFPLQPIPLPLAPVSPSIAVMPNKHTYDRGGWWARGKWRGNSPAAAARHPQSARVHTVFWKTNIFKKNLAQTDRSGRCRLTCKQPRHISRALTRETVCEQTSGEDARGLRPTCFVCLYDLMYMYTRTEPTYESGKTQAWGRTPLEVNTNSFFFILNRCQCLFVSAVSVCASGFWV